MQIIHIYIISPFKCKTFINNVWEYGRSFFSPNCFVLYGSAVNQVFYGVFYVLGSFQSAVEQSKCLRVFTATFQESVVWHKRSFCLCIAVIG